MWHDDLMTVQLPGAAQKGIARHGGEEMARCFITGVELPLRETRVLDISAAYRALRDLRHRAASVERLIHQLGPYDDTEAYDPAKKEIYTRRDRRLICPKAAEMMTAVYPEGKLFIRWEEWRARRLSTRAALEAANEAASAATDAAATESITGNGQDSILA